MIQEFWCCLRFFTLLPAPHRADFPDIPLAQAAWAFPLAGAVVGMLAGGMYLIMLPFAPPTLAAWAALAALVVLTGGLHEDGLADTADALAPGRTRERKLAILRDSRIGSYGVLALILALALRANAMAALPGAWPTLWAFIAAGAASRACLAVLLHTLPPARADGLAAGAGRPSRTQTLLAVALGAGALLAASPCAALLALPALALVCFCMRRLAQRHFGGVTGDVLGAAQQAAEITLLLILVATLG